MDPVRVYRPDHHRFYDELFNMLVSYLAFGSAGLALKGLDATYRGNDTVNVDGKAVGFGFLLRASTILPSIVADRPPDQIELRENPFVVASGGPPRMPKQVLRPVFHAAFVHFYESMLDGIEASYGRRRSSWHRWPEPLRSGMVVRDAFTHGGTVDVKGKTVPSISWRGLSYSPSDNGHQVLYTDLMPADLIVLMEDMDDEIPR